MSLLFLDRLDAGGSRSRRRGKGAVADLQLDHVLALGLQRFRHRQNVKSRFSVKTLGKRAQRDHEELAI